MSFPVTRPTGRALLVGNTASLAQPLSILGGLGFACEDTDDVYIALATICKLPQRYQAVVMSLTGMLKEELQAIATIKRRLPQVDIWVAQADGRHGLMIEAIRLGADGLLAEDGLHRIGMPPASRSDSAAPLQSPFSQNDAVIGSGHDADLHDDFANSSNGSASMNGTNVESNDHADLEMEMNEPVLSADELRALLQEQPFLPPNNDER